MHLSCREEMHPRVDSTPFTGSRAHASVNQTIEIVGDGTGRELATRNLARLVILRAESCVSIVRIKDWQPDGEPVWMVADELQATLISRFRSLT